MFACSPETASGDQLDPGLDWLGDEHALGPIFIGQNFNVVLWLASGESFAGEHPIMKITPTGVEYLLADPMGSVIGKADATGTSTASIKYDSFGNVTSATGVSVGIDTTIGSEPRFHGMALDAVSGLYYVRARTYDSGTGRFTSRDPFAGVVHGPESTVPYSFALNNPQMFRDPGGRFTLVEVMVAGAIGGILAALPVVFTHLTKSACKAQRGEDLTAEDFKDFGIDLGSSMAIGAVTGALTLGVAIPTAIIYGIAGSLLNTGVTTAIKSGSNEAQRKPIGGPAALDAGTTVTGAVIAANYQNHAKHYLALSQAMEFATMPSAEAVLEDVILGRPPAAASGLLKTIGEAIRAQAGGSAGAALKANAAVALAAAFVGAVANECL